MQNHNKTYGRPDSTMSFECRAGAQTLVDLILTEVSGFTISLYEFQATIPSLWETVKGTSDS